MSASPEKQGVSSIGAVENGDTGEQTAFTAPLPVLFVATRRWFRLLSAFTVNKSIAVYSAFKLVLSLSGSQFLICAR